MYSNGSVIFWGYLVGKWEDICSTAKSDNNGGARSSFAQQPVLYARNPLAQLTDGSSAWSSESSDISMRSSASRLGLFLLALPPEPTASRNSLLSILDWSLGADATSARKRRSLYASKARSSYSMISSSPARWSARQKDVRSRRSSRASATALGWSTS